MKDIKETEELNGCTFKPKILAAWPKTPKTNIGNN